LVFAANQQALYTSTGMSFYNSVVVPADTVPPAAPGGLSGGSGNPNTAFLNWTAATDNVGVAGYYVLRNGSVVGTTANPYYLDSGLTESTAYAYWVEAFDLAGNISAPTPRINVTTKDVTPPSTPGGVAATASSSQKVTLTWTPSTDNAGVGSYLVFWGLSPAALIQVARTPSTTTSYMSYPLTAGTTYYYGVEAVDTSGNVSLMSAVVQIATPMPPAAPAGLAATAASASKIGLTWSASASGGLPVQYYKVLRGSSASNPSDLSQVASVGQTSYTDTSVNPAATYYYAVEAADTGADLSPMSAIVSATTPARPAAPTGLVATPASTSRIGLTWSAASGGLPIQNYRVYRGTASSNLIQVAVVPQTQYWDTTVTAAATYYYGVQAADTAGDLSPTSAIVTAAVPSAPSAPAGLLATPVSTTKIGLIWSAAASGGLPIQYYRVFRGATAANLSQVATVAQPAYTDASGSPATKYYYAVQAADTGGDLSPMSATVSATTLALPSAPANLTAAAPSRAQVVLGWTAAQSGMPLAWYSIYRGSSPSSLAPLKMVPASQSYTNDYTAMPNTTYYYGIRAQDIAGNLSPMSAIVSVATPH